MISKDVSKLGRIVLGEGVRAEGIIVGRENGDTVLLVDSVGAICAV